MSNGLQCRARQITTVERDYQFVEPACERLADDCHHLLNAPPAPVVHRFAGRHYRSSDDLPPEIFGSQVKPGGLSRGIEGVNVCLWPICELAVRFIKVCLPRHC
jgi:hypothetical protein